MKRSTLLVIALLALGFAIACFRLPPQNDANNAPVTAGTMIVLIVAVLAGFWVFIKILQKCQSGRVLAHSERRFWGALLYIRTNDNQIRMVPFPLISLEELQKKYPRDSYYNT